MGIVTTTISSSILVIITFVIILLLLLIIIILIITTTTTTIIIIIITTTISSSILVIIIIVVIILMLLIIIIITTIIIIIITVVVIIIIIIIIIIITTTTTITTIITIITMATILIITSPRQLQRQRICPGLAATLIPPRPMWTPEQKTFRCLFVPGSWKSPGVDAFVLLYSPSDAPPSATRTSCRSRHCVMDTTDPSSSLPWFQGCPMGLRAGTEQGMSRRQPHRLGGPP